MTGYIIGQTADLVAVLAFTAFAVLVALGTLVAVALGMAAAMGDRQIQGADELAERRRRRERAQEREARAMLRPPRDIVVAANGREPDLEDFRRAIREGKDL